MTNHQHAATGRGPGSGPRPMPGAGPRAAAPGTGAGEEPRPPGHPGAQARESSRQPGADDHPHRTGEASVTGTTGTAGAGPTAGPDADRDAVSAAAEGSEGGRKPFRFRRSKRHKMIAGVCAGLGRQYDMDPVIFRITLAVLAATGGMGLIFYGFAWLLVPSDDEDENEVRKLLTGRVDGQALAGVLFALVGCGVFLSMLKNGSVLTFAVVLSLLLAGAGYWSRHRGAPDPDPLAAQAAADAPPEAQAPPFPASYPSWWREPIVKDGTHVGGTGYLWGPQDSRDRDIAAAVNISLGTRASEDLHTPRTGGAEPPRRPRGPRWIGGWIFLLALVAGGLGTRLTWDDHALGTSLQAGLGCALAVFGLGIAVSAFLGRTGAGSVLLAIITAALLTASAALPKNISTQWTHATWRPATTAEVQREYDLGTGEGTLDLTRIHIGEGRTVTARAEVGAGRLRVIVPQDVTVRATIDVGLGDVQLPGESSQDVDVTPGRHQQVTLPPASGGKGAGTLELDLRVGMGQAEVSRAAS
ncbi:PspC domain-containing protein [Streptomyces sp. GMY01]|uniref:PspC domain-containing protein n=1 Tax=Streptomyces sp. GMY02 TaxID=1333528 RepID=UPI00146A8639|nr:PspC domain-containing protein [Streptomyces sp. GMY02]NMO35264.1 PspC domain-containing protein [Streptomyces sp. GMY02]